MTQNQIKTSSLNSGKKASQLSLLKMVGDILDVQKMEGGKFQINKTYGLFGECINRFSAAILTPLQSKRSYSLFAKH